MRDRGSSHVRRSILAAGVAISALALPAGIPAHAAGGADMRIDSVQTSVSAGPVGTTVTFRIVAENAGPDPITSSLDVSYDEPMSIHTGTLDGYDGSKVNFDIVSETCAWDGFGGVGPSPDTPFCEFGPTAAGDTVYVEVVATIARHTPSRIAALGFRVTNEADEFDPNLRNNAAIARVRITN